MTKTGNAIIFGVGTIVIAAATWLAFEKPVPAPLPPPPADASVADTAGVLPQTQDGTPGASALPPAGKIVIHFLAPTSTSQLIEGISYDIRWSKPAGVTGQLYLVNAVTGGVVGWVEQNIGPSQTLFPWDARSVFVSALSPVAKNVLPGEYVLKLSFPSAQVPPVTSAAFSITATTTTE
jgi:hypothetical protein